MSYMILPAAALMTGLTVASTCCLWKCRKKATHRIDEDSDGMQKVHSTAHGLLAKTKPTHGKHLLEPSLAPPSAFSGQTVGKGALSELRLDMALDKHICIRVDTKASCGFDDYLTPNEGTPWGIQPHLDAMSKGLIVSVGTERSFYDLLLSDPEKCTGLVVRDINPKIKAYVDFNVLLLIIAESREEYCLLAQRPEASQMESRIKLIQSRIHGNQHIPPLMQKFYQENLNSFALVFYSASNITTLKSEYIEQYYAGVCYYDNDHQFIKLQNYARTGKIVATIGDINDLTFLGDLRVSIIDISNVPDYFLIDINGCNLSSEIRIIWTLQNPRNTSYYSTLLPEQRLQSQIRPEFYQLTQRIQAAISCPKHPFDLKNWALWLQNNLYPIFDDSNKNPLLANLSSMCCERNLIQLKRYCEMHLLLIPGFGEIDMNPMTGNLNKLDIIPHKLLIQAIDTANMARFAKTLAHSMYTVKSKTYLAFINVPKWKNHFETLINHMDQLALLETFKTWQKEGLLQQFITDFGADRIQKWSSKHRAMLADAQGTSNSR
jgi:hypothetical protein